MNTLNGDYSQDVVSVGGNVIAETTDGTAYGVEISNAETANVTIGGMAYALSINGAATAVDVSALYDVSVSVGGDARAVGYSYAKAIGAGSYNGNVSVTVGENAAACCVVHQQHGHSHRGERESRLRQCHRDGRRVRGRQQRHRRRRAG